jgi:hypothetical protein
MDTKSDLIKNKRTGNTSTSMNASKNTNPIHDTAGGEMPDPGHMPSKTKFHTDNKKNSKGGRNARISK